MKDFLKNLLPEIRPTKQKDSNDELKREVASLYITCFQSWVAPRKSF